MLRTALLALALPTLLPAQEPGPSNYIARLAHDDTRTEAAARLVQFGKQACPAFTEFFAGPLRSDEDKRIADRALPVLRSIGLAAGSVLPALVDAVQRGFHADHDTVLMTLAELAPGSKADTDLLLQPTLQQLRTSEQPWVWERLCARMRFPRDVDVATLQGIARGHSAFRIELAVQLLAQRGADATVALPTLRALLDCPDPDIVGVGRSVPLRQRAAEAMLAIGASGEDADAARAVLAGAPVQPLPVRPLPERLRQRIAELIGDLQHKERRDAARQNLVAIGAPAGPALIGLLQDRTPPAVRDAAIAALGELGPRAAEAAPELSRFGSLASVQALAATAPWCRDVIALPGWFASEHPPRAIFLASNGDDAEARHQLEVAQARCGIAIAIDPNSTVAELVQMLDDPYLLRAERALVLLAQRGEAARMALPAIGRWLGQGSPTMQLYGGDFEFTVPLRELAAKAVVAIAAAGDPLLAEARQILATAK